MRAMLLMLAVRQWQEYMLHTHSDLNLAIGATAIAEHPCPDNLDSKTIHLLQPATGEAVHLGQRRAGP